MELMVAVAILGILSAIAIPSYQDSVMKSRRADAKSALLNVMNGMERSFSVTSSYCNLGGAGGSNYCADTNTTNDTGSPTVPGYTIPQKTLNYYNITISSVGTNPPGYVLQAAPIGAQQNDVCNNLFLDSLGNQTFDGSGGTQATCW